MSVFATSWAWRRDLPPLEKYVLVCMADAADHSGVTKLGVTSIAQETGLSERAVKGNLAKLVEKGVIIRVRRFRGNGSRTSDWTILGPGAQDRTPMKDLSQWEHAADVLEAFSQGQNLPEAGEALTTGSKRAPQTREEDRQTQGGGNGARDRMIKMTAGLTAPLPDEMAVDAVGLLSQKRKVNGHIVTGEEMQIAAVCLAEFNAQSGFGYSLGANLTGIVMRVRDHPSWDAEKHRRLVQSAFRFRWWERSGNTRRPTPNVIWGNERCFQNVAQDAAEEHAGTKTPEGGRFRPQNAD